MYYLLTMVSRAMVVFWKTCSFAFDPRSISAACVSFGTWKAEYTSLVMASNSISPIRNNNQEAKDCPLFAVSITSVTALNSSSHFRASKHRKEFRSINSSICWNIGSSLRPSSFRRLEDAAISTEFNLSIDPVFWIPEKDQDKRSMNPKIKGIPTFSPLKTSLMASVRSSMRNCCGVALPRSSNAFFESKFIPKSPLECHAA